MARMSTGADIYTRTDLLQTLFDTPYVQEVINHPKPKHNYNNQEQPKSDHPKHLISPGSHG